MSSDPIGRGSPSSLLPAVAGLLFAIGLGVSGMTDANKVIHFLDLGRGWDPSLAFVMIGAIGVHMFLFRVILRRPSPLYDQELRLPTRREIDRPLVVGAALFGAGWGLVGFCPGPPLVSMLTFEPEVIVFVAAMLAGILVVTRRDRKAILRRLK